MITLQVNDAAIKKALAEVEKQMRFACALALTRTVQAAQAAVIKELPQHFTIRTGWVAKGIRIRTASKSNLSASVRVMDPFMVLQETGGSKASISGKDLGVPIGARPTPKSVTRPSKFPRSLLQKRGYFIAPITGKALTARSQKAYNVSRRIHNSRISADDMGVMALWHRRGKKSYPIDLIYIFKDQVRLPPRFKFQETVRRVVEESFPKQLADALRKVTSGS